MEVVKPILKNILSEASGSQSFKRNLAKEYLQMLVLEFIYSSPKYNHLFFYGGSCLAHCFGLPRLSEDLDFVDEKKIVKMNDLASDLEDYFKKNIDIGEGVKAKAQKFRVYLKFPILEELEVSRRPEESVFVFLKVEVFSGFDFCKNYKSEVRPIFKFNRSVLIKTFDLPTLMATKLNAVLSRKWEKADKSGRVIIKVKGRDYFDLMWYLEKGIMPNMDCVREIESKEELKEKLLSIVSKIDSSSIRLDLEGFINDENFIKGTSANIKDILAREIKERL